jgi:hypothetical protein
MCITRWLNSQHPLFKKENFRKNKDDRRLSVEALHSLNPSLSEVNTESNYETRVRAAKNAL